MYVNRKLAAQLVDPFQPGEFNQALMELGATVCTPLSPSCHSCPVSVQCCALSISGADSSVLVTDYPVKVVKPKQRHDFSAVCVVQILRDEELSEGHRTNNGFLLVKRPDEGLLAGLWEFPSVLLAGEADLVTRRKAIDQYLNKHFRLNPRKTCDIVSREYVGENIHVFTHIRLKMYVELLVLHLKGLIYVSISSHMLVNSMNCFREVFERQLEVKAAAHLFINSLILNHWNQRTNIYQSNILLVIVVQPCFWGYSYHSLLFIVMKVG